MLDVTVFSPKSDHRDRTHMLAEDFDLLLHRNGNYICQLPSLRESLLRQAAIEN